MNEQEIARALVESFLRYTPVEYEMEYAKQCALICVEEIIDANPRFPDNVTDTMLYWQNVKSEIEKL